MCSRTRQNISAPACMRSPRSRREGSFPARQGQRGPAPIRRHYPHPQGPPGGGQPWPRPPSRHVRGPGVPRDAAGGHRSRGRGRGFRSQDDRLCGQRRRGLRAAHGRDGVAPRRSGGDREGPDAGREHRCLRHLPPRLREPDEGRGGRDRSETGPDPICGMEVDIAKAKAAGRMATHKGQTYYFCSDDCKEKFAKEPTRYYRNAGQESDDRGRDVGWSRSSGRSPRPRHRSLGSRARRRHLARRHHHPPMAAPAAGAPTAGAPHVRRHVAHAKPRRESAPFLAMLFALCAGVL